MLKIKRKRRYIVIPLLVVLVLSLGVGAVNGIGHLLRVSAITTELNWEKGSGDNLNIDDVFDSANETAELKIDDKAMFGICYSALGGNISISSDCLVDIAEGDYVLTAIMTSKTDSNVTRNIDFALHIEDKNFAWQQGVDGNLVVDGAYAAPSTVISIKLDGAAIASSCYELSGGNLTFSASCLTNLTVGEHFLQVNHTGYANTDWEITDSYSIFVQATSGAVVTGGNTITTFRVYFDENSTDDTVNGMPGTMIATSTEPDFVFTIPKNKPTRKGGFKFLGWSLLPDMAEPSFVEGNDLPLSAGTNGSQVSTVTLYAVWEDEKAAKEKANAEKTNTEKIDKKDKKTDGKSVNSESKDDEEEEEEEEEIETKKVTTKDSDKESTKKTPRTAKTIENVPYSFTTNTQDLSNGADLTLVGSGSSDKFFALYIDETLINNENYSVSGEGSTTIVIGGEFAERLGSGEHSITAIWTDGRTDGTLSKAENMYTISNTTPQTAVIPVPDTNAGTTPYTGSATKNSSGAVDVTSVVLFSIIIALGSFYILRRKSQRVTFKKR